MSPSRVIACSLMILSASIIGVLSLRIDGSRRATSAALLEINRFLENPSTLELYASATKSMRAALDLAERGDFSHFEGAQDKKTLTNILETINTIIMSDCNEKLVDELINYETILLESAPVGKYTNKSLTLMLETQHLRIVEACKRSAALGSFLARKNTVVKSTHLLFDEFAELILDELDYHSDSEEEHEDATMSQSNTILLKASQIFTGASDRIVNELILSHFVGTHELVEANSCKKSVDLNLIQKLEAYKSLMSSLYEPVYKLTKFQPEEITGPIASSEKKGRQIFALVDLFTDYIIGDEDAGHMFLVYNFVVFVLERSGELCASN